MSFELERIFESKREYRQYLARLPVAEKLTMLDELRERMLAIRKAAHPLLHDASIPYRVNTNKSDQ